MKRTPNKNRREMALTRDQLQRVSGGESWGQWCQDRWDDMVENATGVRGGIRRASDAIGSTS